MRLIRRTLAVLVDTAAVTLAGYLAFRLGVVTAPCRTTAECFILTPMVVVFILAGLVLYFGLAHVLWHSTPGQVLFDRE